MVELNELIHSLKNLISTTKRCKDVGIRKSKYVEKSISFLAQKNLLEISSDPYLKKTDILRRNKNLKWKFANFLPEKDGHLSRP